MDHLLKPTCKKKKEKTTQKIQIQKNLLPVRTFRTQKSYIINLDGLETKSFGEEETLKVWFSTIKTLFDGDISHQDINYLVRRHKSEILCRTKSKVNFNNLSGMIQEVLILNLGHVTYACFWYPWNQADHDFDSSTLRYNFFWCQCANLKLLTHQNSMLILR